jgi:hypothetical protein
LNCCEEKGFDESGAHFCLSSHVIDEREVRGESKEWERKHGTEGLIGPISNLAPKVSLKGICISLFNRTKTDFSCFLIYIDVDWGVK